MIRNWKQQDVSALSLYISKKLNVPISEATLKARKVIKSGLPSFLKEESDLTGVCWIEARVIDGKKLKFIEILANNWRLAEDYIQCLRWEIHGEYYFSVPRHDSLNRTYNKNGIRYLRVEGDKNIYVYRFERRNFVSYKSEDND